MFFPLKLPAACYGGRPGVEPGFSIPKPFIISIPTKELQKRRGALNKGFWSYPLNRRLWLTTGTMRITIRSRELVDFGNYHPARIYSLPPDFWYPHKGSNLGPPACKADAHPG